MPYLDTAESWLAESTLLLKARPTTTRITTKYRVNPRVKPSTLRHNVRRKAAIAAAASSDPSKSTETKATGPSILVLKTYDPVSRATLKYKTDKAADVGRLIASLGRLGRHMAALPETAEVVMEEAPEQMPEEVQTPPVTDTKATPGSVAKTAGPAPTGKKGKKNKGKK